MRDRAVVVAEIERLKKIRGSGVSSHKHGENEIRLSNIETLDRAIDSAEAELAAIDSGVTVVKPPAIARIRSRGRGL